MLATILLKVAGVVAVLWAMAFDVNLGKLIRNRIWHRELEWWSSTVVSTPSLATA